MLARHTASGPAEERVYPTREDTELLIPFARRAAGLSVVEIGVGSGAVALAAARAGARVVGTDRNPHALRVTRARARSAGVALDLVRTDLAHGLGPFDRLLANPPYLPTRPRDRDPDRWHHLALDGGPDGWRVAARIVRSLPRWLAPHGRAYLVVSSLQDARRGARLRAAWSRRGGTVRVVAERVLPGERLWVWEFARDGDPVRGGARRTRGSARRTVPRRRPRSRSHRGSSRATGPGRRRARDGASARRRSPRGS